MKTVLVSAGDASGEAHAARLVDALRSEIPDVALRGIGGGEMQQAGVELIAHQRELAIGGLVEVARDLRRVLGTYGRMRRAVRDPSVDLLILVDSPDFNLPLAGVAKRAGVPVLYYISPQIWAWRAYRIRKIARCVDRMCVIFPFEKAYYRERGVDVEYVGHPLVDRFADDLRDRDRTDRARRETRAELGASEGDPLVVLLPGSRRNEIAQHLDIYLETARLLARKRPSARFVLGVAPSLEGDAIADAIRVAEGQGGPKIEVLRGRTIDLARAADVALCKPGTVTLELALLGTPTIVAGRIHPFSALLLRYGTDISDFALPNIVACESVIPEFLQEDMRPDRIAMALDAFLDGPLAERQKKQLAAVVRQLGEGGGIARAAAVAAEMVHGPARA